MVLGLLGVITVVTVVIIVLAVIGIAITKNNNNHPSTVLYNTVEHKCRKCNKYLGVHGIFISNRKDNYCTCEDPQYYSIVESVKREL